MARRVALLIASIVLVTACGPGGGAATGSPVGAGGGVDAIKSKGQIVLGVKFDVTGFGLRNPTSGDVEGLDADLGREIAKDMGVRPVFIEAVSANRIPFLQQDKVDLIISTFTINEERKQQIDFSVPYYIAGQSILVKKESTIQSVTDLNGKKVCSGEGSTSEKNVRAKAPQAQLLLFKTYTEAGQALSDGRCDAVSTDDSILFGLAEKIPGTELRGGVFTEEPLGIGVKKGRTDLVDFVNATLRKMKDDGRLKAAYDKHIKRFTGQDVTVPF
jgi:ABC-type amino acid transport substrate-binding protein